MARDLLGRVLGYGNRQIGVDSISGNPIYSDQTIAAIHAGRAYESSYYTNALAAAGVVSILLVVGSRQLHIPERIAESTAAPILMSVYRNPVTTANATALRLDNLYDQSNTASFALYHTPTITSVGTQRGIDKYIISNSTNPAFASVRSGSSAKHYVFNANTNYLLQCTNNSASTATLYLEWLFYEQMS